MKKEELRIILENQLVINEKFTGKEWYKEVDVINFETALFTEIAEYFESCPENWKWWRKNLKNDVQNLYVEAIDAIHFSVSVLLHKLLNKGITNPVDYLLREYEEIKNAAIPKMHPINAYFVFHTEPNLYNFFSLVKSLFEFAGLDENKALDIYLQKAKINIERAEGGYKDGKYQKINENGEEDNRKIKV